MLVQHSEARRTGATRRRQVAPNALHAGEGVQAHPFRELNEDSRIGGGGRRGHRMFVRLRSGERRLCGCRECCDERNETNDARAPEVVNVCADRIDLIQMSHNLYYVKSWIEAFG